MPTSAAACSARPTTATTGRRSTTGWARRPGSTRCSRRRDLYAGTYGTGIFRSTDNGDHWSPASDGLTTPFVLSFTTAGGHVLAGAYFGGGVFRLGDDDIWVEKNQGLIATDVRAIASKSNGDLFAGTFGTGMYRSGDSGQSWAEVNQGLPHSFYVRALAINSGGAVFAGADFVDGGGGVYRSTDNGASWQDVTGPISTDVRALAIDSSGRIYAGTYSSGGVYRSTNNGDSWQQVNTGLDCPFIGRSQSIRPATSSQGAQAARPGCTARPTTEITGSSSTAG